MKTEKINANLFKRKIKGCTREKIVEINWELNPSYHSLVFVFSIYSWDLFHGRNIVLYFSFANNELNLFVVE